MDREDTTISTTALVGLQGQLNSVRSEIVSTNTSLQSIGRLIQTDTYEDQKRLFSEREYERRLLENKIRTGQEEALQQRVSSSLLPPVAKLEKSLNSTFNNVGDALTSLFGSFNKLTIVGIGLAAAAGIVALRGIGDSLRNSFNFISSTLQTVRDGFNSVLSGVKGISDNIFKTIEELKRSPVKAISDWAKNVIPGIGSAAQNLGTRVQSGFSGMVDTVKDYYQNLFPGRNENNTSQNLNNAAISLTTAFNQITTTGETSGSKSVNLMQTFGQIATIKTSESTGKEASSNNLEGGKLGILANYVATLGEAVFGKDNNINSDQKISDSTGLSPTAFFGQNIMGQNIARTNDSMAASPTPVTLSIGPTTDKSSIIQPPPRKVPPGTEPKAQPDIVLLKNDKNQKPTIAPAANSNSPLTDVPLISPSNPDNFYPLYAQSVYNA